MPPEKNPYTFGLDAVERGKGGTFVQPPLYQTTRETVELPRAENRANAAAAAAAAAAPTDEVSTSRGTRSVTREASPRAGPRGRYEVALRDDDQDAKTNSSPESNSVLDKIGRAVEAAARAVTPTRSRSRQPRAGTPSRSRTRQMVSVPGYNTGTNTTNTHLDPVARGTITRTDTHQRA